MKQRELEPRKINKFDCQKNNSIYDVTTWYKKPTKRAKLLIHIFGKRKFLQKHRSIQFNVMQEYAQQWKYKYTEWTNMWFKFCRSLYQKSIFSAIDSNLISKLCSFHWNFLLPHIFYIWLLTWLFLLVWHFLFVCDFVFDTWLYCTHTLFYFSFSILNLLQLTLYVVLIQLFLHSIEFVTEIITLFVQFACIHSEIRSCFPL